MKILKLKVVLSFILALILVSLTIPVFSADVTLQWTHSNPEDVDGYKVYYGTTSGAYLDPIDIGNQTSYTFTLGIGIYYFAVTAYNEYGESGYSEEVSCTIIVSYPSQVSAQSQPVMMGILPNLTTQLLAFTWYNNGADSYKLYKLVGGEGVEQYSGTANTCTISYSDGVYYVVSIVDGVESFNVVRYTLAQYNSNSVLILINYQM